MYEFEYEVESGTMTEHAVYVPPGKSALEVLAEKWKECLRAGGRPILKTRFGRKLPKGVAIFVCMFKGEKVKGGYIRGLPEDLIKQVEQAPKGEKWKVVEAYLKSKGLL